MCGFPITQKKHLIMINCGLELSMFNVVFGAPEVNILKIQEVINTYKGQPFAWWVPPSQRCQELSIHFKRMGFVIEAIEQAMICDLLPLQAQNPVRQVTIEPAFCRDSLDDFIQVLEPYDPAVRLFYERVDMPMEHAREKLFVAYKKGKPVATGILYVQDLWAGIFSVLTQEAEQSQGIGTQMMTHLMFVAKGLGVNQVFLSASSDVGFRLYERLGFKTGGQFDCFEWKGNASA